LLRPGTGALRGIDLSLLTGGLSNGKSGEYALSGEGYSPSFAGILTLLRPGTGALRGIDLSLLTGLLRKSYTREIWLWQFQKIPRRLAFQRAAAGTAALRDLGKAP